MERIHDNFVERNTLALHPLVRQMIYEGTRDKPLTLHWAPVERDAYDCLGLPTNPAGASVMKNTSTSLERAWSDLNRGDGRTPEALVEALMFSLRRGVGELTKPDTLRRLLGLNEQQLEAICLRAQEFRPEIAPAWSADDVDLLISAWRKVREQR